MAQSPTGPLRRPQQHEEIADYLRDEIFAGHIPAGESLPSEVELCEQFNTSRGPVRQAVASREHCAWPGHARCRQAASQRGIETMPSSVETVTRPAT